MHNALSSWNLSLPLSYSYLVLKQVFIVISQELSMACFFLIGSEKSVRMGRNSFETLHQIVIWGHIKYITKPKKEGSTSMQAPPFGIQIVLVYLKFQPKSRVRKYAMVYGVQLHSWKSHMRKWVFLVLD